MTAEEYSKSNLTDEELIALACKGDQQAMYALYYRHRDWVYHTAYRFVTNADDALDVSQEVFAYFFKKFPNFKLTCKLTTFLYPAVRNRSYDLLRKKQRLSEVSEMPEIISEDKLSEEQKIENFRETIKSLEGPFREIIILRYSEELSLEEIAERLDIPKGTVKSRLHNAVKKLRESLT